ncbi:acyl carrier protein, partial [Streptomyces sp. NPDC059538]
MTARLTMEELAALMKKGAGVTVDPAAMASRPDSGFDEWGLDSLG